MAYINQIRSPDNNIDIFYGDNIPELFADGIGDMVFLGTHVKISLFQTRGAEPASLIPETGEFPERREVKLILTMPVAQFVESFSKVLVGLAAAYPQAEGVQAKQRENVAATLARIASSGIAPPQDVADRSPNDAS